MTVHEQRRKLGGYAACGPFSVSLRAEQKRDEGTVLHILIFAKTPGGKRFYLAAEDVKVSDYGSEQEAREAAIHTASNKLDYLLGCLRTAQIEMLSEW